MNACIRESSNVFALPAHRFPVCLAQETGIELKSFNCLPYNPFVFQMKLGDEHALSIAS